MTRRRGHVRPTGSTTKMRLRNAMSEPELGGLVYDDPIELERGYRIVGVEEVARPGRWNLILERMDWPAFLRAALVEDIAFAMVRDPR